MSTKSRVVVIGKRIGTGHFELTGAGRPTRIVPATRVSAHVRELLDRGRGEKVLADLEGDDASFVRELAVNDEDLGRFTAVLERYRRAGIAALVPDPARHLDATLRGLAAQGFPQWDPAAHLLDLFLRQHTVFPDTWWHDDPEPGIDEMMDLLEKLGVKAPFPKPKLLEDANADLDGAEDDDDEDAARFRLCVRLCATANLLLEAEGHASRFCGPFYVASNDGEPNWLVCAPSAYAPLVDAGILAPWTGQREAGL